MNVNIPNVDDAVVQRLKQLAWQEGVSFDDSLRRLLTEAAFMRGSNPRTRDVAPRRFKQPA
jgi:plasmid stability protein